MSESKFDFNIVRRQPEPKKRPHKPKKIVAPSDIVSNKAKSNKSDLGFTLKQVEAVPVARRSTKDNRYKSYKLFSRALPTITVMLIFALLIQSASYLMRAKGTSGIVLGSATTAYESLDDANKSLNQMDFGSARDNFNSAQDSLAAAQSELNKFWILTAVAPQARGADNVLRGASFLAEAGKNLTRALQLFDELDVGSDGITTDNFTSKLRDNHDLLKNSRLMLSYAQENFDAATGLPAEYQETLDHAKDQINTLSSVLDNLISLEDLFLSFFGVEPKTYLLAFQNYDEMRATGGFIGTYGVLKYQNGIINQLKIESIYNIDGSLTKQIAAPGPFQPEINKWALRDSNWFTDFPTSAKKMLAFFEMESQTADGVIALTPQVFEDVLKLVGNIRMDQYGVILTPENFQKVVQTQTSHEYDKELNQPKKFLDDFAPVLLNRMSSLGKEEWFTMFQILKNNFHQKHVMMYSTDPEVQSKISNMNFDGRILNAPHDYLAVFNSNHGGTKTDLDINQNIDITSKIHADGSIINSVTIKRYNNSADAVNGNFMRVLIPHGSTVTKADGFIDKPQHSSTSDGFISDPDLAEWDKGIEFANAKIRTESGKTSVTGWLNTEPQTESVITLEYVLPIKINTNFLNPSQVHSFLFQKQPGSKQTNVILEWVSESRDLSKNNTVKFESNGQTDQLWYITVGK